MFTTCGTTWGMPCVDIGVDIAFVIVNCMAVLFVGCSGVSTSKILYFSKICVQPIQVILVLSESTDILTEFALNQSIIVAVDAEGSVAARGLKGRQNIQRGQGIDKAILDRHRCL